MSGAAADRALGFQQSSSVFKNKLCKGRLRLSILSIGFSRFALWSTLRSRFSRFSRTFVGRKEILFSTEIEAEKISSCVELECGTTPAGRRRSSSSRREVFDGPLSGQSVHEQTSGVLHGTESVRDDKVQEQDWRQALEQESRAPPARPRVDITAQSHSVPCGQSVSDDPSPDAQDSRRRPKQ